MLWNPIYETGVPIMDTQHKELFAQIDKLLDKTRQAQVGETLDFLAKYVVQHFSTEESLQTRSRYPKFAAHRKMHVTFVDTYKRLRQEYEASGNSPLLLMKISQTALRWLKDHIKVHDKEFAAYYLTTPDGAAAAKPAPSAVGMGSLSDKLAKLKATTDKTATPSRAAPAPRAVPASRAAPAPRATPVSRAAPAPRRPAPVAPLSARTPQPARPASARPAPAAKPGLPPAPAAKKPGALGLLRRKPGSTPSGR